LPDRPPSALQIKGSTGRGGGLRMAVFAVGKSIYFWIPYKYRHKILFWFYRNLGFLFAGLFHYQNWRNNQMPAQSGVVHGEHNLIDI
jgi:hypothetical protein